MTSRLKCLWAECTLTFGGRPKSVKKNLKQDFPDLFDLSDWVILNFRCVGPVSHRFGPAWHGHFAAWYGHGSRRNGNAAAWRGHSSPRDCHVARNHGYFAVQRGHCSLRNTHTPRGQSNVSLAPSNVKVLFAIFGGLIVGGEDANNGKLEAQI